MAEGAHATLAPRLKACAPSAHSIRWSDLLSRRGLARPSEPSAGWSGSGEIPAETDLELRWTRRLVEMDKFVLSRTLESVDGNARVLRGDIAQELRRLKNQPGGDLLLLCGPSLLAELTAHRLVDEYMLYMCPSAIGQGTHLFRDIARTVRLEFQGTTPFRTGVNLHVYVPDYQPERQA